MHAGLVDSDNSLAARAQSGDAGAYGRLVDRYQERLLRFLLVRGNSRADAEDVLQETFLDGWRYLHSFDDRWQFSTWVYRIALRNAARQARHRLGDSAEPADQADPHADPLAACEAESGRENLWRIARRVLKPEALTALWLYYVDELPQKEVARALQRSLPWTKVTLMRARRRLQFALQDAGYDDAGRDAHG